MKKRDIIIVTVCIATALICIALTFWGNYKYNGVLSPDAFYGVLATFIGICATIIVGFQIASFVKIHETERQIKEVQDERDNMKKEKEEFKNEIAFLENELSNAFVALSDASNNKSVKVLLQIMSISNSHIKSVVPSVLLHRYKTLKKTLDDIEGINMCWLNKHIYRLKKIVLPQDIEHYTEMMKLHFEIIDILEKVTQEETKG